MKVNEVVEVVQPPIGGVVVDVDYDKTSGELKALVEVGEDQRRWYPVADLRLVPVVGE